MFERFARSDEVVLDRLLIRWIHVKHHKFKTKPKYQFDWFGERHDGERTRVVKKSRESHAEWA